MMMRIWGAGTSRTMRVIWTAEELGLSYEHYPIGPRTGETRTPEYTRMNPKQKIPFFIDGDLQLSESVAICRYLLNEYPSDSVWRPENSRERAIEDDWICYVYGEVDETSLYVMRRHRDLGAIYGEAPGVVASSAEYVKRHLHVIEGRLQGREYLAGPRFGLADLLLKTCLDWAAAYEIEIPSSLETYRQTIGQRPAFKKAATVNFPRS